MLFKNYRMSNAVLMLLLVLWHQYPVLNTWPLDSETSLQIIYHICGHFISQRICLIINKIVTRGSKDSWVFFFLYINVLILNLFFHFTVYQCRCTWHLVTVVLRFWWWIWSFRYNRRRTKRNFHFKYNASMIIYVYYCLWLIFKLMF